MKPDSPKKVSRPQSSKQTRLDDRIRQARLRAGLTKAELARRVGVCPSAVVQWEHPTHTVPNTTNLARIAEITGVAFEWLATGRGPPRLPGGDGTSALDPALIAATLFEERLLQIARRLPRHQHEALLAFLATRSK
ncbi:MAG TPA: helix-turn-helix domain-containing protein [Rhodanobacteraceae bacterium]|nr:helix-turn-helix domain-containing protein [Rhodanobacteraceae bacterium]